MSRVPRNFSPEPRRAQEIPSRKPRRVPGLDHNLELVQTSNKSALTVYLVCLCKSSDSLVWLPSRLCETRRKLRTKGFKTNRHLPRPGLDHVPRCSDAISPGVLRWGKLPQSQPIIHCTLDTVKSRPKSAMISYQVRKLVPRFVVVVTREKTTHFDLLNGVSEGQVEVFLVL